MALLNVWMNTDNGVSKINKIVGKYKISGEYILKCGIFMAF